MNIIDILILAGYFIGAFVAMYLIFFGCIYGAMYTRLPKKKLQKVIELAELTPKKHAYDLGAGYGRIGLTAAESGAHITLVEIDRAKTFWLKRVIQTNAASTMKRYRRFNVDLIKDNVLNVDLKDADIIFAFLSPPLMQSIAKKPMRKGTVIISIEHKIKCWAPIFADEKTKIYKYIVP